MTIALATSWTDAAFASVRPAADRWLHAARALDVRACFAQRVPARPRAAGQALKGAGVAVVGLDVAHARLDGLASSVDAAAALRAAWVVVDGGAVADREAEREGAVEALLRALHPAVRAGAPIAVRGAAGEDGLLRLEEMTWVLEELPRARLVLDAAQVTWASRQGFGAGLSTWLDAHAGRIVALIANGMGSDGAGHRHPEDGPPDWSTLSARVSRQAAWIFDPVADLAQDEVADGLRALHGLRG